MSNKYNIHQKNMVPVLLISFSDVLYRKNISHVGSVEKYWGVVQVPLIDDFYYFNREQKLYKACVW